MNRWGPCFAGPLLLDNKQGKYGKTIVATYNHTDDFECIKLAFSKSKDC